MQSPEIRQITIVSAQGVDTYEVGKQHDPRKDNAKIVSIQYSGGFTDCSGRYFEGCYLCYDKGGNIISSISGSCPVVVDYFN